MYFIETIGFIWRQCLFYDITQYFIETIGFGLRQCLFYDSTQLMLSLW